MSERVIFFFVETNTSGSVWFNSAVVGSGWVKENGPANSFRFLRFFSDSLEALCVKILTTFTLQHSAQTLSIANTELVKYRYGRDPHPIIAYRPPIDDDFSPLLKRFSLFSLVSNYFNGCDGARGRRIDCKSTDASDRNGQLEVKLYARN